MPQLYPYRCQSCGECMERVFPMAKYPPHVECPACGGSARRIIARGIQSNVDRVSEEGFDQSAGRHFHNRGERRQWMKEHGLYEISPEEKSTARKGHQEIKEAKADLGDAWTGDIPGRRKEPWEVEKARKQRCEELAERIVHEAETMTEAEVEHEMNLMRAEEAEVKSALKSTRPALTPDMEPCFAKAEVA